MSAKKRKKERKKQTKKQKNLRKQKKKQKKQTKTQMKAMTSDSTMRLAHKLFSEAKRDRDNGKFVDPRIHALGFKMIVEPWVSQVNDAWERGLQARARKHAMERALFSKTLAESGEKEKASPKNKPIQIQCMDCENQGTLEGGEFDEDLGIVCQSCYSDDVYVPLDSQMRTCLERGLKVLYMAPYKIAL